MEATATGGYRLRGESPVKQAGMPLVSVITVVFNGLDLIEKTIRSVLSQTWPNIEYIVIDGHSTDGTTEIIRLYDDRIAWWISEPDRGIYDAMNKGLAAATGDFVWFMNAGDLIYSDKTTEQVFEGWEGVPGRSGEVKVLYGDTMVVDAGYQEIGLRRLRPPKILNWKSFKRGMLVCHQAILVDRLITVPFDPRYSHSADFDWVINVLKKAEAPAENPGRPAVPRARPVVNTGMVLCAFLDGGHSKKNIGISLRERFQSMSRHYGLVPTLLRYIPITIRFAWYFLINRRF